MGAIKKIINYFDKIAFYCKANSVQCLATLGVFAMSCTLVFAGVIFTKTGAMNSAQELMCNKLFTVYLEHPLEKNEGKFGMLSKNSSEKEVKDNKTQTEDIVASNDTDTNVKNDINENNSDKHSGIVISENNSANTVNVSNYTGNEVVNSDKGGEVSANNGNSSTSNGIVNSDTATDVNNNQNNNQNNNVNSNQNNTHNDSQNSTVSHESEQNNTTNDKNDTENIKPSAGNNSNHNDQNSNNSNSNSGQNNNSNNGIDNTFGFQVLACSNPNVELECELVKTWESDAQMFYLYNGSVKNISPDKCDKWNVDVKCSQNLASYSGWNGKYSTSSENILHIQSVDYNSRMNSGNETVVGFIVSVKKSDFK